MSDVEEEDYMSDKLLVSCENDDIRPGLLFNKSQKRQHELYKKKEEHKLKKPKTYKEQEKETREKGLDTAISSNNIGFKLLEKMGYKNGTGLGKSRTGIVQPITIKTKDTSSGIGREEHIKNMMRKKSETKEKTLKAKVEEFQISNTERRNMITLQKDYKKAQRICEDLDFKNGLKMPEVLYFWTKETRKMLMKKNKTEDNDNSEEDNEDEQEGEEEEEEVEEINEKTLNDIINYLRKQYNYCMYCGDYVEENEEEFSCPGYFRKDHDD